MIIRPGLPKDLRGVFSSEEPKRAETPRAQAIDRGAARTIAGPSRQTPEAREVQIDAAAKAARHALARVARKLEERIDTTDRKELDFLRALIVKAGEALSIALSFPELRADDPRAQSLSLMLGRSLGPLDRLLWRLEEAGPHMGNKSQQLAAQIRLAYDKLIAPAIALREATAGEFVPISEAVEIAKAAHAKLERTVAKLAERGRPLSKEAEAALFKAILSHDRFGLVMSIDAGVFDFLPEHLAKAITRDHHGIHHDPRNPEVNSTMRLLEDVEEVRALPISLEEKIARLRHDYRQVVTNNLGDAILPIVLAQRIPELVERGGIEVAMKKGSTALLSLEHLKRLAHFEDFGFFGSGNVIEGRKRSAPGEIVLRDLIHVVLANYQVFDELLEKFDIRGSDRFDGLPAEKQRQLVEEAAELVAQNLSDYDARMARAERFKNSVVALTDKIGESHESMRRHLEEKGVSKEDLETLDGRIFYFFSLTSGGRFATWDAPSLAHKSKIQWESMKYETPEGTRWGFVLAVPSEREPDFLDTTMVKAFGPRFPKAIARGDTLLFVFKPEDGVVPPEEMAKILAEELRKHEVTTPKKPQYTEPKRLLTPGDNVISNDAYLYDDRGDYVWTPERFADAQRFAREAYEKALASRQYDKVVLVMGLPSSGKSTWVREHQDERTLFVDSTLTTPEKRKELVAIARKHYKPVEAVWIDTPLEICCDRMRAREDRDIPLEWMQARHEELRARPPRKSEGLTRVRIVRPEVAAGT